ncbi:uncharacterized protein A4U43_C10F710 [Asparagus officinalis]|uniref:Survival Motor Neuron Gemin2-binding domain-containing protein n=1 Tax=Asparagus officinalis TaxID=4686 RepID=A0A5P1DZK3_ASPOF|nr:uncharacterized protein LOC109825843 isoform X2 [Asparagus officinalis]ONK55760.1 uncharacterized protein A4U43_C10F710 [Asparagus officinalis]
MGKGNDPWDDSALTDAFDRAMSTYKKMHLKGNHGGSVKEGKHASDGNEKDTDVIGKAAGHVEPGDESNKISDNTKETFVPYDNQEMATKDSNQENHFSAGEHVPESGPCSSGLPPTDENTYDYSNQQSVDYAQLCKQYYELEDQKQKLLQQLHQANYWNYQTPASSSTYQLPQLSEYNGSEYGPQTACSLCSCHCIAVPVVSTACTMGAVSAGGYSCPSHLACCSVSQAHQVPVDDGQNATATVKCVEDPVNVARADDSAIKAGMWAVERAINSMKLELSATSNDGKGKQSVLESNASQSISSDTDLTAVLNAWYMAGFHTGRYLSEKSRKNANA